MTPVSRRSVLKAAAASALASAAGVRAQTASTAARQYPRTPPQGSDVIHVTDTHPVVETAYGRIRGYVRNGMNTFKAVPYGADTSGANRFRPPQPPKSWTGVRSCLYHGYVCPQPARTGWQNNEESWLFSWDDGIPSEDCLNLNVWTRGLDGAKRPVMVWWSARLEMCQWRRETLDKESIWDEARSTSLSKW